MENHLKLLTEEEKKQRRREACKLWRTKNPEKNRENVRQWRLKNPGRVLQNALDWQRANPEKVRESKKRTYAKSKLRIKNYMLQWQYGISLDEYNAMVERQSGRCAICEKVKKLSVDHCHTSGRVRKLLCSGCNTALGGFNEDCVVLSRAIAYIEQHR